MPGAAVTAVSFWKWSESDGKRPSAFRNADPENDYYQPGWFIICNCLHKPDTNHRSEVVIFLREEFSQCVKMREKRGGTRTMFYLLNKMF